MNVKRESENIRSYIHIIVYLLTDKEGITSLLDVQSRKFNSSDTDRQTDRDRQTH